MDRLLVALLVFAATTCFPAYAEDDGTAAPTVSLEIVNATPALRLSVGYHDDDYACSGYHPIASMAKVTTKQLQLPRKSFQTLTYQYTDIQYKLPDSDKTGYMNCTGTFTFRADDADAYRVTISLSDNKCRLNAERATAPEAQTEPDAVKLLHRKRIIPVPDPAKPWCEPDERFANSSLPADAKTTRTSASHANPAHDFLSGRP